MKVQPLDACLSTGVVSPCAELPGKSHFRPLGSSVGFLPAVSRPHAQLRGFRRKPCCRRVEDGRSDAAASSVDFFLPLAMSETNGLGAFVPIGRTGSRDLPSYNPRSTGGRGVSPRTPEHSRAPG